MEVKKKGKVKIKKRNGVKVCDIQRAEQKNIEVHVRRRGGILERAVNG